MVSNKSMYEDGDSFSAVKVSMKRNLVFRFFEQLKSLDTKTHVLLFKNLKFLLLSKK